MEFWGKVEMLGRVREGGMGQQLEGLPKEFWNDISARSEEANGGGMHHILLFNGNLPSSLFERRFASCFSWLVRKTQVEMD